MVEVNDDEFTHNGITYVAVKSNWNEIDCGLCDFNSGLHCSIPPSCEGTVRKDRKDIYWKIKESR